MRRSAKWVCLLVFALVVSDLAAAPAVQGAGDAKAAPAARSGLVKASLFQAGRSLVATVRTRYTVPLAGLDPKPNPGGRVESFLCLELRRQSGDRARLCFGGRHPHRSVGLELTDAQGGVRREDSIPARVKRPSPRRLVLIVTPGRAGLRPHRYRWRVIESRSVRCAWAGSAVGAAPGQDCVDALPTARTRVFRLRPVRAVGCSGGRAVVNTDGPGDRRVVALTFDDGPSEYTPGFLDVLRAKHVRATFFEVGQELPGRTATLRRILREGHEIGNHTMHHGLLPGYSEIALTSARIEASTHFRPCLFRPPGGALNSAVIDTAARLGMRTVLWDVDPSDWSSRDSGSVYSRVVSAAGPGSIILMHDGGGDRSATLTALPRIIDTLRGRGYRFATVTELLGGHLLYRPYG